MFNAEENITMGETVRRAYAYNHDYKAVNRPTTLESILKPLMNVSFLPVNSASETVVIRGQLAADPNISVFLKIFDGRDIPQGEYNDENVGTLNLQAEYKIYNELYKLRKLGVTPNVLARVGTFQLIPTNGTFLREPALQNISTYDEYFRTGKNGRMGRLETLPGVEGWQKTMCIMSCSVEFSLHDIIKKDTTTFEDVKGILYQIMHLLTWFEHIEMAHHDLHTGNIRIEYHAEPIELYYQHREEHCVLLNTKYVVKVYDFDRSTIYKETDFGGGQIVRPVHNYKKGFGVFNAKEDAFKIITTILMYKKGLQGLKHHFLLMKLIPGINGYTKLGDVFKNLPENEKILYDSIMVKSMCSQNQLYKYALAEVLDMDFYTYYKRIEKFNIISIPANYTISPCSLYLPNSIMLPHLEIMDVLGASFNINPVRGTYPTPNIYYKMAKQVETIVGDDGGEEDGDGGEEDGDGDGDGGANGKEDGDGSWGNASNYKTAVSNYKTPTF